MISLLDFFVNLLVDKCGSLYLVVGCLQLLEVKVLRDLRRNVSEEVLRQGKGIIIHVLERAEFETVSYLVIAGLVEDRIYVRIKFDHDFEIVLRLTDANYYDRHR